MAGICGTPLPSCITERHDHGGLPELSPTQPLVIGCLKPKKDAAPIGRAVLALTMPGAPSGSFEALKMTFVMLALKSI